MYFLRGEVRNVFTMLLDASQASSCVCPLFQFVPSCSVFSVFSVCVSGWQCEEERGYLQKTRRALHETPVSVLTDFVMSLRHTKNVYQGMASWRPPVLRRCASNVIYTKKWHVCHVLASETPLNLFECKLSYWQLRSRFYNWQRPWKPKTMSPRPKYNKSVFLSVAFWSPRRHFTVFPQLTCEGGVQETLKAGQMFVLDVLAAWCLHGTPYLQCFLRSVHSLQNKVKSEV